MGCINSKKKLTELRSENAIRVRAVQLPAARNGSLELNPRELIFYAQGIGGGQPSVIWALQHLRRYGLNGDIFTFEAGRRCMTGPGIYTFRCQQAERLYQLFQRYVNAVSVSASDDVFARDHPSHALGRAELANSHANNYLEPAPLTGSVGAGGMRSSMHETFSSSPLSLELDSPDSVPSVSFTNEVVHFQSHQSATPHGAAYVNTSNGVASSSNIYLEHPLRSHLERNNNNSAAATSGGSAFSTLRRKAVTKRSSLDVPPEECAPILTPPASAGAESLHMYANVETLGAGSGACNALRERDRDKNLDPAERCYENLTRLDLPLLLKSTAPSLSSHLERSSSREQQQPGTPGSGAAVNYIVLDLDQPRSPAQCSPKTCFGSGLSLATEHTEVQFLPTVTTTTTPTTTGTAPAIATSKSKETIQLQQTESTLGYSTIDFIKTCALIKSTTHGTDLDPADHEELRITRHSKCVRKAYSISE